jgi:DNA-binding response OmpR family regulator
MPYRVQPRILIVEDNDDVGVAYGSMFRRKGYEVLLVETKAAAIANLGPDYDLIYLDVMLPDGSGVEVLAEIRRRGLAVKVAVVTGTNPLGIPGLKDVVGDALVLTKPYAIYELTDLAEQIARDFQPQPEPGTTP